MCAFYELHTIKYNIIILKIQSYQFLFPSLKTRSIHSFLQYTFLIKISFTSRYNSSSKADDIRYKKVGGRGWRKEERRICDKFKIRRTEARIHLHGNKRFSCSACNPRGSPCKQREESADRLSRSKLTLKPCRLFHAKSKKKKERKRTSLVLYVSIPPPISRAPSIKPDRSGSVPREANSIRVSCDRGDAKLEAGLSIQPRVSLRESKK